MKKKIKLEQDEIETILRAIVDMRSNMVELTGRFTCNCR